MRGAQRRDARACGAQRLGPRPRARPDRSPRSPTSCGSPRSAGFPRRRTRCWRFMTDGSTTRSGWSRAALELGGRAEAVLAAAAYAIQLYLLRREQGRAEEALEPLARVAAESPARPFFRCALASLLADLGRLAEARQAFEELAPNGFEIVPRDNEWLLAAAFLVRDVHGARRRHARGAALRRARSAAPRAARRTYRRATRAQWRATWACSPRCWGATTRPPPICARRSRSTRESGGRPWVAYAKADLADVLAAARRARRGGRAAGGGCDRGRRARNSGRLSSRIERSRGGS